MSPSLLLLVSLTLSSAGKDGKAPRTGDFKDDFLDPPSKATMHYRLRAPEKLPAQNRLGLIVCFHGLHGNEDSITDFAVGAVSRAGLLDQYVIMGGKSKGTGWEEIDDKDVLAWLAWIMKTYPIDPRRVHAIGMSNGGGMVKRFGFRHQDLFASVTSYCGVEVALSGGASGKPPPATGPMSPAETRTEWYIVHGNADKTVDVGASRRTVQQLRVKGYRCIYREIEGADHGGILGNADVADDVIRFLHAVRHKEVAPSKEEKADLASMPAKLKSGKLDAVAPVLAEAERIGGPAAAKAIVAALGNSDADVKKAAAKSIEATSFGREAVVALVKLLKDKSDDVKAAAYRALASESARGSPEALDTLLRAARAKTTPPAERALAIEGLGKTVKLEFLGSFEDKLAIWSLVLLLEDADQKTREVAFAQLEKLVPDTFGYKPDQPEKDRKAAALKWRSWTATKCGPLEKVAGGKKGAA